MDRKLPIEVLAYLTALLVVLDSFWPVLLVLVDLSHELETAHYLSVEAGVQDFFELEAPFPHFASVVQEAFVLLNLGYVLTQFGLYEGVDLYLVKLFYQEQARLKVVESSIFVADPHKGISYLVTDVDE